MRTRPTVFAAVLLLAATTGAPAQQAPKPEQLIKWRQSAYQTIAWATGRVKANVDGTYNKDEVVRAANAIAAVANAGLPSLFPAGTETGKGWKDTTVKASFITNTAGAAAAQAAFVKEANELARLAPAADVAAVKTQLAALQKTCKTCHDDYRNAN